MLRIVVVRRRFGLLRVGVPLRCAPGRAARAVGNEPTVANGAEPPPRPARYCCAVRSGVSALRARIPHANPTATAPVRRLPGGPSPPGPRSRTRPLVHPRVPALYGRGGDLQSRSPAIVTGQVPRTADRPPLRARYSPVTDPSAQADITSSVPRFQSPGPMPAPAYGPACRLIRRSPSPTQFVGEGRGRGRSAPDAVLTRDGPVGAGRHHVVVAAISIAGARGPPLSPGRRLLAYTAFAFPHGLGGGGAGVPPACSE